MYTQFAEVARATNNEAILTEKSNAISVIVGCDTRPSSEALVKSIIDGVSVFQNAKVINYGILTTPQLHWMVWRGNEEHKQKTVNDYYEHVGKSYGLLVDPNNEKKVPGTCHNY